MLFQKCLVQTDTEVNVEIENAVDIAKEAIARIKNTVVKVEEELDITPNTSTILFVSIPSFFQ